MSLFVHISAGHTPAGELVFFRALFTLIVLSPFVYRDVRLIFSRRASFVWLRSLAGSVSMLVFYWTLQHTTVGRSAALTYTAPVFVIILSWRFFSETISLKEAGMVGLALSGVALLYGQGGGGLTITVALIGLFGAATAGVAYVSLRQAAADLSVGLVVWAFSLVMFLIAVFVPGPEWSLPEGPALLAVLGVCISGALGQIFLTLSYVHLRAPIASALGLSSLVFGVLFESIFYWHLPSLGETISYSLILAGISLLQIIHRGHLPQPYDESTEMIADQCDALVETTTE